MNATKHGWPSIKHPILYTFSIILFFTSFSFSSISLPSSFYICSFSIFSLNVCWSFLACVGVMNFYLIPCPSSSNKVNIHQDWAFQNEAMPISKEDDKIFVGTISHNTSFTHCPVLNFILAWFGWELVDKLSFSTNLWLTTLLWLS